MYGSKTRNPSPTFSFAQVPYKILTEAHLKERQSEAVEQVTGLLGIPESHAEHILRLFKWSAFLNSFPNQRAIHLKNLLTKFMRNFTHPIRRLLQSHLEGQ